MPDNKTKKGKQDDLKIDSKDLNELRYAAKKSGTTPQAVKKVISKIGNNRKKVEEVLSVGSAKPKPKKK